MANTGKGYLNKDWSTLVNVILAFFTLTNWLLGGLTRIKRGKTVAGVVFLLTGGFFGIGMLIDFVTLIVKKDLTVAA